LVSVKQKNEFSWNEASHFNGKVQTYRARDSIIDFVFGMTIVSQLFLVGIAIISLLVFV
jgi:hypothetical protein